MRIITALGNEEINKRIKEKNEIDYKDIQYQEGVIDILEKNKNINLLILNSLLPGELKIEEFINIIKYKNPDLKIIIILAEANERLKNFLIAKGIEDIYYNNKITIEEILEKINNMENTSDEKSKYDKSKKIKLINHKSNKKIKSKNSNKNIIQKIFKLIILKLNNLIKILFRKNHNIKLVKNNKIIIQLKHNKIIISINLNND